LSVFERGATLGEIAAVWRMFHAGDVDVHADEQLLDGLAALADQGLIRLEESPNAERVGSGWSAAVSCSATTSAVEAWQALCNPHRG
jgi:hypothetical protein